MFEKLDDKNLKISRYLLDIDPRFSQFYNDTIFSRYNMFNNHFFTENKNYLKFLNNSKKILILVDPPYGGIIKLIAKTFESIKKSIFKLIQFIFYHQIIVIYYLDLNHDNISFFLFYPYFNETWIKTWMPDFNMLDYKVIEKLNEI